MDIRVIVMVVAAVSFVGATWVGFNGARDMFRVRIGVILVGFGTILPVITAIVLAWH